MYFQTPLNQVDYSTRKGLWNPKNFIAISIFFSFLPAVIMYALNYGRVGNIKKRNISLLLGFTLFIIIIVVGISADTQAIKSLFFALNIGLGIFMKKDQISLYNEHIDGGGKKASILIPLFTSAAILLLGIWGIFYSIYIPDQKVTIQGDELYYTKNVSKDDVDKLGKYLETNSIFIKDDKTISVKIDKKSVTYIFSIVVSKEKVDDGTIELAKSISQSLSSDIFNNEKVEVNLCDDRFKSFKTVVY